MASNSERFSNSQRPYEGDKDTMKIAVGQVQLTPDVRKNKTNVERRVETAAKQGAALVVFPELSILEFFPRMAHRYEFFDLAEEIGGPTTEWFASVARKHGVHIAFNQYERSPEQLYFDTSVIVDREGEIAGRQRMMHIAEEPGYNEKFYYTPGVDSYSVFELDGWKFGIATCYDRHFPEVFRSFTVQGAEAVLVPTGVAATEPFTDVYEMEMRAAAVTHGVYVAMANRAGTEAPLTFLGRSMVIDPMGSVVMSLDEKPDQVVTVDLQKEAIRKARVLFPYLRDRRPETYSMVMSDVGAAGGGCCH